LCDKLEMIKTAWDQLEKLADARNSRAPYQQSWATAGPDQFVKSTNTVKELPPEVIAPSLKKMPKSAGFGTNIGNTNRDS
jgi:hypothetical protein